MCVCVRVCINVNICIQSGTTLAGPPFKRGSLSSGVEINTYLTLYSVLSSGLTRGCSLSSG